jgi:hypothetical protein
LLYLKCNKSSLIKAVYGVQVSINYFGFGCQVRQGFKTQKTIY